MTPSRVDPAPGVPGSRPDGPLVLIVSVGATTGWRAAARELAGAVQRAGARTLTADTGRVPLVRTFMLTDLVQAAAARRTAARAIAAARPDAVIYCSITAALLWPRPGAIWLDTLAAENRPGRHGVWQRPVERRRLADAPLLLTMAPASLEPWAGAARADPVVVPVAIEPSGPPAPARDVDVLAYAADPVKRRLDVILAAWGRARRDDETLLVAGIDRPRAVAAVGAGAVDAAGGVEFLGRIPPDEYRALLRRTRVFLAAPRREDFGIAALEALADGALLVTTPAEGPYPALALARRLDPRLVSDDLPSALRHALDSPPPNYAHRAAELVGPFRREAVTLTVRERVLPRLLPGFQA